MSGFDLVPVDGGDPIHLPPGETVLGRGPFLRVSDKRVSRLHGLLENMNGQLRLKPTHLNPCFVQSSLTDEPRPLQRDVWHPLHHGALFSLLPGRYTFQVVAVGGEDTTPRNSQMFEEEVEELHVSPAQELEPPPAVGQDKGQTPPREENTPVTPAAAERAATAAPSKQEEVDHLHTSLDKKDSSSSEKMEDNQNNVAPSVTKRRVLPSWMMAAVGAPGTSSSTPKALPAAKAGKKAAAASTGKERAAAARRGKTSAEEAELSEEEKPKKRRRKIREEEEEESLQSKAEVISEQVLLKSNSPAVNDDKTMRVDEEDRGRGETSTAVNTRTPTNDMSQPENEDKKAKNGRQTAARAESVRSDSSTVSRPAPSRPQPRTPCPYGKDCYRKNPLHFQECSHPGDSDYEDEEEEEISQEERPECPYGTDCYRKNPLHRKEYKHTQKPAYATRRVPKKTAGDDEDEDEDSGDDDSFINDDSEDVGDDSDYVPPESDDSGKEDVKRLQREATAFLRQKK